MAGGYRRRRLRLPPSAHLEAKRWLLGFQSTESTLEAWPANTALTSPVATSKSLMSPSSLPDNRAWLSGEKASALTGLTWAERGKGGRKG